MPLNLEQRPAVAALQELVDQGFGQLEKRPKQPGSAEQVQP